MSDTQTTGPGRVKTIVTVLVLTVVLGASAGILGGAFNLSPAVTWAIFMPNVYLVYKLLTGRRRPRATPGSSMLEHVLLDAGNTGGRVVQTLLPLIGTLVGAAGVAMLVRAGGGLRTLAVVTTIAGLALIVLPLRKVIAWDVSYKGHAIRFENDPCFGERLLIDGQLVDRGGVGLHMELSGTIASGDGAGDVIHATSYAGLPTFHCRIVALSAARAGT